MNRKISKKNQEADKYKKINLKEIDEGIKNTREDVRQIENDILEIHKKMALLL